jgi:hypothetical protein
MSIRSFVGWGSIAFAIAFAGGCDKKKDDKSDEKSEKATKDDGDKKSKKKGSDDEKYTSGEVVKYLPKSCKGGRFYMNIGLFLKNEATEKAAEALEEKMSGKMKKKDAQQMGKVLKSLKKSGIDPARDIKEIAFCMEAGQKEGAAAIGGNFAGKDPIGAIAKASSETDEELEKKTEDGVDYIKSKKSVIGQVAPNVVVITDNKASFASLKEAPGGESGWDIGKGRIFSFDFADKKNGKFTGSITENGEDLDFKVVGDFAGNTGEKMEEDPAQFKKGFEAMRDKIEQKLSKGPFKKIADDIGNAKIKIDGTKLTITLTIPANDLGDSIKKAANLSEDELENSVDL